MGMPITKRINRLDGPSNSPQRIGSAGAGRLVDTGNANAIGGIFFQRIRPVADVDRFRFDVVAVVIAAAATGWQVGVADGNDAQAGFTGSALGCVVVELGLIGHWFEAMESGSDAARERMMPPLRLANANAVTKLHAAHH